MKRPLLHLVAALPAVLGLLLWPVLEGSLARAALLAYTIAFAAFWTLRLLLAALRRLLWRIDGRLALSYFLIGLVPLPLVVLLGLVGGYIASGFLLGHLYRDAVHSVASELRFAARSQVEQIERGHWAPARTPIPVHFTYYKDGRKVAGVPGAPETWQGWWMEATIDTAVPAPIRGSYVALDDGRPTLLAGAVAGRWAVLALYGGDLESELSERSGVWVELLSAGEASRNARTVTVRKRDYKLELPRLDFGRPELRQFFHPGVETPHVLDRPALLWTENARPYPYFATGREADEFLVAALTGSPRTVIFHLVSPSNEVDVFAFMVGAGLMLALLDIWLIAALVAVLVIFGLTRALNRLSTATQRVQRGDFSTRIDVQRGDQVGQLQGSFNQMTINLEELVAQATQKEVLEKELEIARELQEGLLPSDMASDDVLQFATHFDPSAAIGGDYFDLLHLADGRLALVVADVSGHGLSAGLRMAMVKSALQLLCEDECRPETILTRLHRLQRANGRGFVTLTLAIIDRDTGELMLTNAGHTPTYIVRPPDQQDKDMTGSSVEEIVLPSSPLGALGEEFAQKSLRLAPGDAVVWLSDGLIEAMDADDEPFGYDGVVRSLEGFRPVDLVASGAEKVRDRLLEALHGHTEGALPDDDRTLVVMVYRPSEAPVAASSAAVEEPRPAAPVWTELPLTS